MFGLVVGLIKDMKVQKVHTVRKCLCSSFLMPHIVHLEQTTTLRSTDAFFLSFLFTRIKRK